MYSIMDAVEAAQRRTEERDAMNLQRLPVVPVVQTIQEPIYYGEGGSSGENPVTDTRTEHQKYLDAIDANQYIGSVPVIGPVLGVLTDSFIEDYERKNPDMVVGGGPSKFSTLGRVAGKGLTVEEQLEAEKAGIGLGKMLGFGEQNEMGVSQPGYTLFDRIAGTTPMNVAAQGDYIGSFPEGGGSEGGGDIGGYSEEDLSYDSFSGPTGYA